MSKTEQSPVDLSPPAAEPAAGGSPWRAPGRIAALLAIVLAAVFWLLPRGAQGSWTEMTVTATAYNSVPNQTTKINHDVAAWGDVLKPGMKAIAVSRDLLEQGLGRGQIVQIDGLDGDWQVLDKMNRRWTKKIDIYMGLDVAAARQWGRREVVIRWQEPPKSD